MKQLLLGLTAVLIMAACGSEKNTIVGQWKGKNNTGHDIQWHFDDQGNAVSYLADIPQKMFYRVDDSQTPHMLNLNSTVDTNTLRAIYRFTETGKLVIGINNELVTRRPITFEEPDVERIILTRK